ncbi:Zn-ribbon domain-containing OB-fold protein [Sedimenticola selenatireducens]|uniref:Zn-ribbon domain-containing OB-fold protein n=1 Tax=Sedimenticola selenatireducens TaxID=191960 RepID=UPI00048DCFA9|nr:zinc ribbon domain-containing protein [Sedimenticola selenatireducens]
MEFRSDEGGRMPINLSLSYSHGFGAFTPFFDALMQGRILGSRCPVCDEVRFPPRMRCPTHHIETNMTELTGYGRLLSWTTGPIRLPQAKDTTPLTFGLVQLDGAINSTLVRIDADETQLITGALLRLQRLKENSGLPHPIQALIFQPV